MIDLSHLTLLFFTGMAAGTIDAIAGGGGLISLPMLLSVGLPPHIALGTNKLQACIGTSTATYRYYRNGWLEPKKLIPGLIWSFIGAVSGAITIQLMSSDILKKIIPFLLILILIYTLFSPALGKIERAQRMKDVSFYFIFGLLLGFYDGFFGPGAGSFWTFALMFFMGFSILKATAYTKAFNLNTNLAGLACFIISNNVNYKIALCMAAGQFLGGQFGASFAMKHGAKVIRPIFLVMVFATMVTLVYRNGL